MIVGAGPGAGRDWPRPGLTLPVASVVSVNVGEQRDVEWFGRTVRTAIWKEPVAGRIAVRGVNLAGDDQADRRVHGGPDKAVYAYAVEDYAWWSDELGEVVGPGTFGENLTTVGLLEDEVSVGDEFRIGSARLVATQPRQPCFKLGLRFDDPWMVRRFRQAGRPGIYFAVVEEGEVGPDDPIECTHRQEGRVTVADLVELIYDRRADPEALRRALAIPALAAVIREEFEDRLRA